MSLTCRICGKGAMEIGGYLQRVNAKGNDGIWECKPSCQADLPNETKLILALEESNESKPRNLPPHQKT